MGPDGDSGRGLVRGRGLGRLIPKEAGQGRGLDEEGG